MNKFKLPIIGAIVGLLIGRFALQPFKTVEVKEVVKIVKEEKNKEQKKKRVVIVEKKDKDGNTTKTTEISEDSSKTSSVDTKTDSSKQTVTKNGPGLTLGLLAIKDGNNFSRQFEYGATVSAPLIGRLKVQGLVTTDKRVGLGLGLEF